MNNNLILARVVNLLCFVVGYYGTTYYYGWELSLFIFLILFGYGLNQRLVKYDEEKKSKVL